MNLRNLAVAAIVAATATAAGQPLQLDPSFHLPVDEFNIRSVLQRPDGKLIISGQLRFPGVDAPFITGGLLNQNGSVAVYYSVDNPVFSPLGGRLTPWGDGFYSGRSGRRFHWDGTLDTTYQPTGVSLVQDGDYQLFPDGRALVTGYGYIYDVPSLPVGPYAGFWLRSDGHVDTTRTPISADGPIFAIREMPDGKFMCSGGGGFVQGHPSPTIFRLHPDGGLDTNFQAPYLALGEGFDYVPVQDGKVLAAGYFKFIGSSDTLSLIRLMPDGSLDPTFHSPYCEVTYDPINFPMIIQPTLFGNDKLIVTGGFDRINGQIRGGIAMLDTAGNLLDGYFEGMGCGGYQGFITYNKSIDGIYHAPDGYFYIYGAYHGYDDGTGTDGNNQRLISRLYGLNVGINKQPARSATLQMAPNPSHSGAVQLSVDDVPKRATLTVHDASGRVALYEPWPAGVFTHTLQAGLLAPGTYLLRVQEEQGTLHTGKLIVLP